MPSWRKARVFSPIFWVGKSAKQMEMSIAVMTSSTTLAKRSASKDWWPLPSSLRNFIRFSEARLQDVLSRCMYSLHGFERGDPAGLGAGVPVVDHAVVLDARVGAGPRGLGQLAEERLGVDLLDDLAGHAGAQAELRCRSRRPS